MMWQLKYQDAVEEGRAEGRVEGREEGRIEGRAEGLLEGKFEFAKALIADGVPIDRIMRYTHLLREDIERLMT